MRSSRKVIPVTLFVCLLSACSNDGTSTTPAVSYVDSAAQSAPDTLRASADTSSRKKDSGMMVQARDSVRR